MDDSFFGFDTTTGIPDDDGQIAEPPEEEYDALNDETFGSAINGDWEEAHETLVRLGGNGEKIRKGADFTDHNQSGSGNGTFYNQNQHLRGIQSQAGNLDDSDLELNLSTMKLDDVDLSTFGESDANNRFNWDSIVWGSKSSLPMPGNQQLFRDNFRSAFKSQTSAAPIGPSIRPMPESNANFGLPPMPATASAKISTLEDIERNLIIQQAIPKPQQQTQPLNQQDFNLTNRQHAVVTPTISQHQQQQLQKPPPQHKVPPGFMATPQTPPPRPNLGFHGPHALAGAGPVPGLMPTPQSQPQHQQHQQLNGLSGNRVPPGFIYPTGLAPNHPLPQHPLPQHPLPQHALLQQHAGLTPSFPRPLPNPHLPTALNNFAMHPSFNAMRVGMHPAAFMQPVPPPRLPPHNLLNQQPNSMYNMFNMRLVQEIQQNHPLLQNAAVARQQQQQQTRVGGDRQKQQQQQLPQQLQQQQMQLQLQQQQLQLQQQQQQQLNRHGGNLPHEEFDEYANLMSTRDKHWLIGIQLSQLNTDTPYIDDYYYTVHKERKTGQVRHSQAHKDNQLNHPLTQPRGHAQLILVQLGNKNGSRNGQQHRERRNSENTSSSNASGTTNSGNNTNTLPGYIFSPLKFENSLGKLQYGSVTAPRKIIDADIMGSDMSPVDNNTSSSTSAAGSQSADKSIDCTNEVILAPSNMRKSRHILLHIETLYRYLLKLEDLESPEVMSTILLKKKKESERIAALEQLEMAHKTPEERAAEANNPQTMNPALKNKFNYEIEARPVLVGKLKSGLTFNKVVSMMSVRKGKILLRRIMPFIADQSIRWAVWTGVFCSLQSVVKKDRDDVEGALYALYPEFKKHIHEANFETIINISAAFILNDKKMSGIFCSRFGILSLVGLILRAEAIYMSNNDSTLSEDNRQKWREFLTQVASCLNRTIQNQTISAAIESDAIQPMMNHFARFKDLKLDALLALITEAKHQIN
ncbi:protein PAT1 homolog 1 [Drosophila innubila]|uniref:protein PAT1 homolog 1 n=1 Tax=Drosophila innubila TaxID=198719 RepID=UPI00148BF1FF|nr:protein PAT1 homolog 1 [Drosophila innubila]